MKFSRSTWILSMLVACLSLTSGTGCISFTRHAIPANRLPHQFHAPSKCNLNPINFSMLQGTFPSEHLIDTGDVLAITVQGVIPADSKTVLPVITGQSTLAREYYPPNGVVDAPNYGIPVNVRADGTIQLPLIAAAELRGLTLTEAAEKIRQAYIAKEIVREGNDQVNVSLLRSRVNRILVLREDASTEAANRIRKGEVVLHKRGSADVIDLPIYESDVLHVLASTGGLPGIDAYNEVWILRKNGGEAVDHTTIQGLIAAGTSPSDFVLNTPAHMEAIRLPLKLCPDEPVPFSDSDVILRDGDVVYIEPRRDEYFYTGGLLPGGQIPLPRDEDLDVLEAIAVAQGSVGGLGGTSSVSVLRTGAGLGNIVPPTRALVLRKLPNGQQLSIRVDLNRAMREPSERIRIMAGDYVMVYYKPGESASNALLSFFNINWIVRGN
jgi:hypothetical protein